MDSLKGIDTNNLHHAYLLEDSEGMFAGLQSLLRDKFSDAEIHVREFDSFGIDDSRHLIHLAGMRSLGTQLFIYRALSCTKEAQNALLKLFEEPSENTHFFVCLSGIHNVLPTLQSRVWMVESEKVQGVNHKNNSSGKSFLHASSGERMHLLEGILKNKDVSGAGILLRDIEIELHTSKGNPEYNEALQNIIDVRRVLFDKGASLKILLESVALTTPRLS
ncbi:MAG: hypothetical protein JKX80_01820 [Candidatus Pacebacteria bacterium]|nr:hypothetical protein [Candidatus Paceibacterota bacterium]